MSSVYSSSTCTPAAPISCIMVVYSQGSPSTGGHGTSIAMPPLSMATAADRRGKRGGLLVAAAGPPRRGAARRDAAAERGRPREATRHNVPQCGSRQSVRHAKNGKSSDQQRKDSGGGHSCSVARGRGGGLQTGKTARCEERGRHQAGSRASRGAPVGTAPREECPQAISQLLSQLHSQHVGFGINYPLAVGSPARHAFLVDLLLAGALVD